jgi:type I restriction enzyme S subunit
MGLRKGYKQTEVGVIPQDWVVEPLHNLSDKIMVGIASAATHAYRDRGVVLFRNQNIKPGYLDDSDVLYIAEEYEQAFKNKRLKGGDLLTTRTGYPGTTCIVPTDYEGAQSFTTLITRPRCDIVNAAYLCAFINSVAGQTYFEQTQIGGGQKNVNAGSLKYLPVALPPTTTEQEAIAEALSDADALIESVEQLLTKKRHLKRGAMQELLTGKKRLPEFTAPWQTRRLGDIGNFLKGRGITKGQALSGKLPCIRYGELYTRHNDVVRGFFSWISPEVAATAIRLRPGDVLFAGSGETKEEIGKCAAFIDQCEAYAGGDIVILRPDRADPSFLGYYLNTERLARQKASLGQGDAVVHIGATSLASIEGSFPQVREQTAIAAVLSDMDAELTTLEAKLLKARMLKQGMTQELLTGRLRLV